MPLLRQHSEPYAFEGIRPKKPRQASQAKSIGLFFANDMRYCSQTICMITSSVYVTARDQTAYYAYSKGEWGERLRKHACSMVVQNVV